MVVLTCALARAKSALAVTEALVKSPTMALGLLALVNSMLLPPLVLVSVVDKLLLTLLIWACELMVLLLRLNCEPLTVDKASS